MIHTFPALPSDFTLLTSYFDEDGKVIAIGETAKIIAFFQYFPSQESWYPLGEHPKIK